MMATAGYRLSLACATSLLVCLVCQGEPAPSLSFSSSLLPTNSSRPASPTDPNICIVVRTYWADGNAGNGNLYSMLKSFQQQSYERWQAVLLVMDDKLFRDLRPTIYNMKDDRIWVFAEHVGPNFKPKEGKGWKPFYHAKLYNLTDEAIRACPRTTEWVLVTNGDNQYSTELFEQIVNVGGDVDAISMDYYSRYQRPTGPPCERFQAAAGLPACKVNRHRFCHTDLGANVLRWPRLIREDRRFGTLRHDPTGQFFAHDGVLMDRLSKAGWNIQRLPKCLFDHSPSPQRCQREGGVWDDSGPSRPESMGGKCVSAEEAKRLLHESAGVLEVIDVALSHDSLLPSFPGAASAAGEKLQCIRKKGDATWQQEALNFFGPKCADDVDLGGTPRTRLVRSLATGRFVVVPLPRRKGSYTPKFRQLMPAAKPSSAAKPASAAARPDRSEL